MSFSELKSRFKEVLQYLYDLSPSTKAQILSAIAILVGMSLIVEGSYDFTIDGTDYYALIVSVVEYHSLYSKEYHLGAVVVNGQVYMGRAPGYSFLAMPFYLFFKITGGTGKFGVIFVNTIFHALTGYTIYLIGRKLFNDSVGLVASVLYMFGTFAIEYAVKIWNHSASAFFVTVALYYLISFSNTQKFKHLAFSAISVAVVFAIRYPEVIIVLPVLLYFFLMYKNIPVTFIKRSLSYLGIVILATIPTLLYHYFAFGNPFITPYYYREDFGVREQGLGLYHPELLLTSLPNMLIAYRILDVEAWSISYHSSLIESSPFLVLSLFGFVYLYRKNSNAAILSLFTFLVIVLFNGMVIYWNGIWCFNMRYLMITLPILAILVAKPLYNLFTQGEKTVYVLLGSLLVIAITITLILVYQSKLLFVLINTYDRPNRDDINEINLFIAICLLIISTTFYGFKRISQEQRIVDVLKGAYISSFIVSFFFSMLLNIFVNIINFPYKNGRVLPYLDGIGKLLGVPVPGYFYYDSIFSVPLVYYIVSALVVCFIIFKLLPIKIKPIRTKFWF